MQKEWSGEWDFGDNLRVNHFARNFQFAMYRVRCVALSRLCARVELEFQEVAIGLRVVLSPSQSGEGFTSTRFLFST